VPPLPLAATPTCPFLSAEDGSWRSDSPAGEHRCHATSPAARIAADRQRRVCLAVAHFQCPDYVLATGPGVAPSAGLLRAVPGSTPTILERPRRLAPVDLLRENARLPQIALAGLLVVALALVLAGRPSGTEQVGGVAPGPTPAPSTPQATAPPTDEPAPPSSGTPPPTSIPSQAAITSSPPPIASTSPTPAPTRRVYSYRVKKGDTLLSISRRFGTTVKALQTLNGITDPKSLRIGQLLKIR